MLEVKIHIVAPELVAALGALIGGAAAASSAKPAAAPKDKPAAADKPKSEDKPKEAAGESTDDKRKQATQLLQKINQQNGIDAVRAALGEFGVANISAVADDKLDEVIAAFGDKVA